MGSYEIKNWELPNSIIYVSVHMCRCWKGEYMHSVDWRGVLWFVVFFSLMHLQVFNLIYSRNRKSLSLLFTVTLPPKWIDGKFFRGKSCPRFYVFCSYVSSFTSVLPVCWEEQAFWRGLAHLDKPSGRVSRPREKVRESDASSEPVVISMWEWGSSNLTLVIHDVGFSNCSSC